MKKRILSLVLTVAMLLSISAPVYAGAGERSVELSQGEAEGTPQQSAPVILKGSNTTEFAGGSGTEDDPYIITTKTHLNNVRNYLSAYYQMDADIIFTEEDFAEGGRFYNKGAGWKPIGDADYTKRFRGTFDGNEHTITGLKIDIDPGSYAYAGLFGTIDYATVKNLGLVDSDIRAESTSASSYAGGVVGYVSGNSTFINCYNTGTVEAISTREDEKESYAYAGGIAGYVGKGTFINCYNTGTVDATASTSADDMIKAFAGGITGYASDLTITDSYNSGNVNATVSADFPKAWGCAYAGGVVANVAQTNYTGTITNCHNTGGIEAVAGSGSGNAISYAGGILGEATEYVTVTSCYNLGSVKVTATSLSTNVYSNSGSSAGGIAGNAESIANCYNSGGVEATATSLYYGSSSAGANAGGIAGGANAITNCYNIGNVKTAADASGYSDPIAGGIAGSSTMDGTITNCYNTGNVEATGTGGNLDIDSGGIVGSVWDSTITNCYYLNTISVGVGEDTDTATSCTKEELKQQATFVGFDFDTVWTMEGNENYLYPELRDVTLEYTKMPESIDAFTKPNKMTYVEGEALDVTGGKLTLTYDNGTSEEIYMTPDMVTGFDITQVGKQTLTVTYEGITVVFQIEIVAIAITSIKIVTLPSKLTYQEGEALDLTGMVVRAHYNNGTYEQITGYQVSGFTSTVGTKTITVSYGGQTVTFQVVVKSNVPTAITSNVYTVKTGIISKIPEATMVTAFLAGLNEGAYCQVYKDGVKVTGNTVVGTGMVVKLMDGSVTVASYTIIVTGDTNGDGKITITDMLAVKAHVLKKTLLSGVYLTAGDTNGDGKITITDFILIKAKILGKGTITAR